jgi:hypothetical protein
MVKVTGSEVFTPPRAVPPLSLSTAVMSALPLAFAAGVNLSVPLAAMEGLALKRAGLVLFVTWKASV